MKSHFAMPILNADGSILNLLLVGSEQPWQLWSLLEKLKDTVTTGYLAKQ